MYFVYILYLVKTKKLYTGSCSNLKNRLTQHKRNKCISTKNKEPILIHYECYKLKSDATRRERYLKTTKGKRFLRQQIRDLIKTLYSGIV